MRFFYFLFLILSFDVLALDPNSYLAQFDSNIYSLKSKGTKDFVVDIYSSRLAKQINEQSIFGKVKDFHFKVYWTANPERLAVEVKGLPEGFKEIKDNLNSSIAFALEDLLSKDIAQKFPGYKASAGSKNREITLQDTTGTAAIPQFILKFDERDILVEILGKKYIGSYVVNLSYEKDAFTSGKYVLKSFISKSSENGQTTTTKKDYEYGKVHGVGVLERITITSQQKWEASEAKPLNLSETVEFRNYAINNGEAVTYFLGESSKALNNKKP